MQLTNGRRARRALHTTLALGLAALAAASPVAFAQAPAKAAAAATPVMTPETAAIRKVLEQKFPGADIRHVARTD
ncbi:MAG: hypothetical protein ACM34F_04040, partial [Betaproteobacteria bacterium]